MVPMSWKTVIPRAHILASLELHSSRVTSVTDIRLSTSSDYRFGSGINKRGDVCGENPMSPGRGPLGSSLDGASLTIPR